MIKSVWNWSILFISVGLVSAIAWAGPKEDEEYERLLLKALSSQEGQTLKATGREVFYQHYMPMVLTEFCPEVYKGYNFSIPIVRTGRAIRGQVRPFGMNQKIDADTEKCDY